MVDFVPFTLDDALAVPDILSTHRHTLFFPDAPVTPVGSGRMLSLREAQIEALTRRVGHVRVNLFGYSVGFRGHTEFDNVLTASFFEDSRGSVVSALTSWIDAVCNWRSNLSLRKSQYSVPCALVAFDTRGKPSLVFNLQGVYPFSISTPSADLQSSTASQVQVSFSVDFLDLVDAGAQYQERLAAGNQQGLGVVSALNTAGLTPGGPLSPAAQNAIAQIASTAAGAGLGLSATQFNGLLNGQ